MKNYLQTNTSALKQKYLTFYERLAKSIRTGRFARTSAAQQQTRLHRLQRYERQLQHYGIAVASAGALFFAAPAALSAQAPAGSEFRINSTVFGRQINPATAMDSDGDYVVVWQSLDQDGSNYGVYGQRYNSSGAAQGGEFRVNTTTTGFQGLSSVAMDNNGNFVVTWESNGQDGSGYGIYAQRYNSSGTAQGSEFKVNTYTTGNQHNPSVAMDSDGDFVIAWESNGQDGAGYGIYAQRYNSSGTALGSEILVNTYTISSQRYCSVAMDSAGDFVVAWASNGQDGEGYGIYGQRYNSSGVTQGGEFRANTYTANNQRNPSVAMDSDGDFVVAWPGDGTGDGIGIYAQRYNSSGTAQGSEFRVNTYVTNIQQNPFITMDSSGDFVIVWESYGQDGSRYGIYARQYSSSGVAQGSEFLVNTVTAGVQENPSIAMNSAGDFVVAWQRDDGLNYGVYGQRYSAPVLPVEQVSFSGKNTEGGNVLTWETANEVNNKGFSVERQQATGDRWETLGFVATKGKSSTYTFTDDYSLTPVAYYRLRQIDNDGKETFSKVISIENKGAKGKLSAYPNPVANTLTIKTEAADDFQIFNLLGQQVLGGKAAQRIDVSALPKGTYVLKVSAEQVKFVKE